MRSAGAPVVGADHGTAQVEVRHRSGAAKVNSSWRVVQRQTDSPGGLVVLPGVGGDPDPALIYCSFQSLEVCARRSYSRRLYVAWRTARSLSQLEPSAPAMVPMELASHASFT